MLDLKHYQNATIYTLLTYTDYTIYTYTIYYDDYNNNKSFYLCLLNT